LASKEFTCARPQSRSNHLQQPKTGFEKQGGALNGTALRSNRSFEAPDALLILAHRASRYHWGAYVESEHTTVVMRGQYGNIWSLIQSGCRPSEPPNVRPELEQNGNVMSPAPKVETNVGDRPTLPMRNRPESSPNRCHIYQERDFQSKAIKQGLIQGTTPKS
jgi:hypothetical protein